MINGWSDKIEVKFLPLRLTSMEEEYFSKANLEDCPHGEKAEMLHSEEQHVLTTNLPLRKGS